MMTLQIALIVGVAVILGLQIYRMMKQPGAGPLKLVSDHGSEVLLLAAMGVGCLALLWRAIELDKLGTLDVAAFLLVIQRVIEAVTARWTQRSQDRMAASLANAPPAAPPTPPPPGDAPPPAISASTSIGTRSADLRLDPSRARETAPVSSAAGADDDTEILE